MNKQRILDDLHKIENGLNTPKTKTLTILSKIKDQGYSRKPEPEILMTTKHEAKTIIIARYGMLVCTYVASISKAQCNQILEPLV